MVDTVYLSKFRAGDDLYDMVGWLNRRTGLKAQGGIFVFPALHEIYRHDFPAVNRDFMAGHVDSEGRAFLGVTGRREAAAGKYDFYYADSERLAEEARNWPYVFCTDDTIFGIIDYLAERRFNLELL